MSESCKLYETLSKANLSLVDKYQPKSYNCDNSCPYFGKCFYRVACPPKDPKLEEFMGGWQKYAQFGFDDKDCKLVYNDGIVRNILHLIHPAKIDDIILMRIVKYNKNKDTYALRYLARQGDKIQVLANLNEMNRYISNTYSYTGRTITKEDFTNG